jgi:YesN/AraC family two-component response regulator
MEKKNINDVRQKCANIINRIEIVLQDFNIKADDLLGSSESMIQKLSSLTNMTDIMQWMKIIIRYAADNLDLKRKSKSRAAVEQVIIHIESKYMENISLDKIAKTMYYIPNYVGNVFK